MGKFKAKLAEKRPLDDAERFWQFQLELVEPHRIEFGAGQFVRVEVGEKKKWKFWMCSLPEKKHAIDLVVDVKTETAGARFFRDLEWGEKVVFEGPEGGMEVGQEDKKLFFVAGEVGIAPIRSMVWDLLVTKRDEREIRLLWGLDYVEEMFWAEEWYQLDQEYKNFSHQITLSHPPMPEWKLSSGSLRQVLEREELDKEFSFYVTGFEKTVEEVREVLEQRGVDQGKVQIEVFGK